jgi:malonyl-CoA/methylmalonyl-CoA synthetase
VLYLAISRIGAIFLPIHAELTLPEIAYILADALPTLLVCAPRFVDKIQDVFCGTTLTLDMANVGALPAKAQLLCPRFDLSDCSGDDNNALVYTSGTTGRPKGAWLSCGQVVWNARAIRDVWQITQKDVLLHLNLMAYGIFGTLVPMLSAGASIQYVQSAHTDLILDAIPHVSMVATVPTVYQRLLQSDRFTASLCNSIRLFITGSAPTTEALFNAFLERT